MRKLTVANEELLPEVVKLLSEGNSVTIKAKGNSMLPFIVGDRDSVVLQKKDTYAIGDIVLAEIAPKLFVLHRIIKIEADKIILMGDGNLSGTEECRKENIHGRATSVIHNGKQVDCNSRSQQRKVRIWAKLLPVRHYLLAIYRRIV